MSGQPLGADGTQRGQDVHAALGLAGEALVEPGLAEGCLDLRGQLDGQLDGVLDFLAGGLGGSQGSLVGLPGLFQEVAFLSAAWRARKWRVRRLRASLSLSAMAW